MSSGGGRKRPAGKPASGANSSGRTAAFDPFRPTLKSTLRVVDDYTGPLVPRDPVPRGVRKHLEMARLCREDFADAWPVAVAEALKCVDRRNGEHGG